MLTPATTWMKLENMMLSEIRPSYGSMYIEHPEQVNPMTQKTVGERVWGEGLFHGYGVSSEGEEMFQNQTE